MNQKINNKKILTKEDVEKIVEEAFKKYLHIDQVEPLIQKIMKNYPDRKEVEKIMLIMLRNYPTHLKMDLKHERMMMQFDEKARSYRDEILTKMDQIVGELAQMREDREFERHDYHKTQTQLDDHEKRLTKLERQKN